MKHLKYIIASALVVMLVSCDALKGDPDLPIPMDETLSNTGAFLRVLSVDVAGFDWVDLDNAEYVFTAEYFDEDNGQLLDNVEFHVSYTSSDESVELDPVLFKTIPASEFSPGETSGLPTRQFVHTLEEVNTALGIDQGDMSLGDSYQISWTLNLTNGKSFDAGDASPPINGGFYNSPYQATSPVAILIPPDLYVGSYTITQNGSTGTFNPVFNASMEFDVDIIVDPANTLNGRRFVVSPLEQFGPFPTINLRLRFARAESQPDNVLTVPDNISSGVGCTGSIAYGPVEDPNLSDFDVTDDSEFTFALLDNVLGDCGGAPGTALVTFTATKN